MLQRERKRRFEAAEAYRDGGRTDLAEAEEREAELIAATCPSSSPTRSWARSSATRWPSRAPTSPKEMGKVMALVMPQVKGRADGKRVSAPSRRS